MFLGSIPLYLHTNYYDLHTISTTQLPGSVAFLLENYVAMVMRMKL